MKRRETKMTLITERRSCTSFRTARTDHSIWRQLRHWIELRSQRLDLAELDDHLLADIGVIREAAEHEGAKPFWRC
jgi:uncharacterized protein YjiS (DUF1127 family)